MSTQDIIDKIQKLRKLAKSANLNEATTAAAIAEKLIAEHRLSEAELSVEKQISEPIIEAQTFLYETGKVTAWKSDLACRLAILYGVYVYNSTDYSTKRKQTRYAMVGRKEDIQILEYQFSFLMNEIIRLCDLNCKSDKRGISVERNSFCKGATDGIMKKLEEEKRAVEKKASSAALVLLDNKLTEAKQLAHEMHNLKSEKSYSQAQFDGGAYNKGKEAGGKIQINKGFDAVAQGKLLK